MRPNTVNNLREETVNNFREEIKGSNLQENLTEVKANLQAVKDSIGKTVTDATQDAEKKVKHSVKKVAVRSMSLQRNVAEYIKENPRKSIGFAVVAGAIISKLL